MSSGTAPPPAGQTAATPLQRGVVLFRDGRAEEALAAFDEAVVSEPCSAIAHSNRAHVLQTLGRHGEAVAAADRALALDVSLYFAWRARAASLTALSRFAEAVESSRGALEAAPSARKAAAWCDLGQALSRDGRLDEAIAAFDAAQALEPQSHAIALQRSTPRLLRRDFAGGWDDYEARYRPGVTFGHDMGLLSQELRQRLRPAPTQADLAGRNVLVAGEQGLGDQIMFASVLPDLVATAKSVTCIVEPRLHALFSRSFPDVTFVAGRGPALVNYDGYDVVVALGSLSSVFRRNAADFPGRPYLAASPQTREAWAARLGPANGRRRIGLSWRGGTESTGGSARSMPLALLRPLLTRADCEFVSLQYGDVDAEIAAVNADLAPPLRAFPAADLYDVDEIAGLVSALDLVITVQTTVAHLAGALGQTARVMIPRRPEWRYGAEGDRLPWYGSLTLMRQMDEAGWPPVIERIGRALDALAPPS